MPQNENMMLPIAKTFLEIFKGADSPLVNQFSQSFSIAFSDKFGHQRMNEKKQVLCRATKMMLLVPQVMLNIFLD